MLTVTVSGSFHRHLAAIYTAVGEFREAGVTVLSPSDPRVIDHLDEFLFVASDRVRSVRLVQDRHLQCIGASTFLWLVAPDGYVGPSASMEIGYAIAAKTPIFSDTTPIDCTLRQYVRRIPSIRHAVSQARARTNTSHTPHLLIDPTASIDESLLHLGRLRDSFANARLSETSRVEGELETTKRFLTNVFNF
jgi:hypothetical protein